MPKSLYLQKLLLLARGISTAEFAFMMVIADHLNEKAGHPRYGLSWPGYSTIQREAKIRSRATVAKLVKSLKQKGLIAVHGDRQEVNCYEPQFEAIRKLCPLDDLAKLESRQNVSELVQSVNQGGLVSEPPVVYSVNQGGLVSEPERPRERPTLTRSKNAPPREQRDLRSGQGGQGRLSDFIKHDQIAEIIGTTETLCGDTLARSTRSVESVATSVVTLFKEIHQEEGRLPDPEEVAAAFTDPAFGGLRGLSFGLATASGKRAAFKTALVRRVRDRKLRASLLAPNAADRHDRAVEEAKRESTLRYRHDRAAEEAERESTVSSSPVLEQGSLPLWLKRLREQNPDDPDVNKMVADELAQARPPAEPVPVPAPPPSGRAERPIGYDNMAGAVPIDYDILAGSVEDILAALED